MNTEIYGYACIHLINSSDLDVYHYFTGEGLKYHLLCKACADNLSQLSETLQAVSEEQFKDIDGYCEGVRGKPEVLIRSTNMVFAHTDITLNSQLSGNILAIKPESDLDKSTWIAALSSNEMVRVDFSNRSISHLCNISIDKFLVQAILIVLL